MVGQTNSRHVDFIHGGPIDDLQSIPRDLNHKDVAAMLDELTIEADEESFVIVLQHGSNDVTCKRYIGES